MEFRTTISIDPSADKISYRDPALFIGSCFASEIGGQLETGRMPVMINPAGAVYNPVSVSNILDIIINNRKFVLSDLNNHNETYFSFYHNTEFSSWDPDRVLSRINETTNSAHEFLSKAKFLFVTFGTARIYRLRENGMIVSNCHKLPSEFFTRELLRVDEIVRIWSDRIERLHLFNPELKIIFTISPVRHWKDGAHGNQVSKSVLFLAVEELLKHPSAPGYFPAFELLLDDLRDYRYYADDMLHPSEQAVEYIWEAFEAAFVESRTSVIRREVVKIVNASQHRPYTDSPAGIKRFAGKMIESIEAVLNKAPYIDLTREKDHFTSLMK